MRWLDGLAGGLQQPQLLDFLFYLSVHFDLLIAAGML